MRHLSKKGLFLIPNLMEYFCLVVIPVFVWLYLHAVTDADYYKAALVMGISFITDMFDDTVARKFNITTEFGKFLGPPADKLTHGAILLCLLGHYPLVPLLVIPSTTKEGFMLVMDAIKLRWGRKLDSATWFGKRCTALFSVVPFLFLLFLRMSILLVNGLILLCGVVMTITLVVYVRVFRRMQDRL